MITYFFGVKNPPNIDINIRSEGITKSSDDLMVFVIPFL